MTDLTDGVTDDIVWIQGTRMLWFNTRLGPEKRKEKHTSYICIINLICNIYCIYLICIFYTVGSHLSDDICSQQNVPDK